MRSRKSLVSIDQRATNATTTHTHAGTSTQQRSTFVNTYYTYIYIYTVSQSYQMENNNILNDVGADDDEDSVPDDDIDEEEDMEDEDEEESEGDDDDDDRVARRHDGVLEGNMAEPLEPGKARRLATDADIVRSIEIIGCGVSRVVVFRSFVVHPQNIFIYLVLSRAFCCVR